MDLALNNLQWLMYHKAKPNQTKRFFCIQLLIYLCALFLNLLIKFSFVILESIFLFVVLPCPVTFWIFLFSSISFDLFPAVLYSLAHIFFWCLSDTLLLWCLFWVPKIKTVDIRWELTGSLMLTIQGAPADYDLLSGPQVDLSFFMGSIMWLLQTQC